VPGRIYIDGEAIPGLDQVPPWLATNASNLGKAADSAPSELTTRHLHGTIPQALLVFSAIPGNGRSVDSWFVSNWNSSCEFSIAQMVDLGRLHDVETCASLRHQNLRDCLGREGCWPPLSTGGFADEGFDAESPRRNPALAGGFRFQFSRFSRLPEDL
jgi:hypothetical protein